VLVGIMVTGLTAAFAFGRAFFWHTPVPWRDSLAGTPL
jgi:hypothetical protein